MRTSVASTVHFTADGNGRRCLASGWYEPEPDYTWTAGKRSVLRVAAPFAPYGFFLELEWRVMLSPPAVTAQAVTISLGDHLVYRASVSRDGVVAFICPPLHPAAHRLTITIDHPDAIRPSQHLDMQDGRDLAFGLRRLRVLNAEEQAVTTPFHEARAIIRGPDVAAIRHAAERITGTSLDEVFSAFELIAGNCDMGIAMRKFGFESLSLLRFGGAPPTVALHLLDTGFAGIGKDITVDRSDDPDVDWTVADALGLRFHTGRSARDVDEAALLQKTGPHLRRLADKLLDEIAGDEKIFVFADHRDFGALRGLDTVLPLYLALRRRGAKRMLWVCPASHDSPMRGSAQVVLPGLVQAHLDLFAPPLATEEGNITLSGWATVLVNAWTVFRTLDGRTQGDGAASPAAG